MSVQAISWVMDDEWTTTGGDRLVLLSIANHADGFGDNSWPSIRTIAREANLTERAVQYAIGRLVKAGLIEIDHQAGGHARMRNDRRPNRYRIIPLSAVEVRGESDFIPSGPARGERSSPRGEKSANTGCKSNRRGVKDASPKPSEPSKTSENPAQPESLEGDPADASHLDRTAERLGLKWRAKTMGGAG